MDIDKKFFEYYTPSVVLKCRTRLCDIIFVKKDNADGDGFHYRSYIDNKQQTLIDSDENLDVLKEKTEIYIFEMAKKCIKF